MTAIVIYTKEQCPYCVNAKQLLKTKGYTFEEIDIGRNLDLALQVVEKSGQRTVPQIFVGEHPIGGYSELVKKTNSGEFDALIRNH